MCFGADDIAVGLIAAWSGMGGSAHCPTVIARAFCALGVCGGGIAADG